MSFKSVFTFIRKRKSLAAIAFVLILSGCGSTTGTIDANTEGWFNHFVIYSFSYLIKFFAEIMNGNYGLALLIMTLLVRFALLPLMMKQYRNQYAMKDKMKLIQPEIEKLKEKYNDKTVESQKMIQKEIMQLYQKHNFNPLAIGCLPMLIQFPILIGFYYAIKLTPEIATHSFLWFNLGQPDLFMPLIAAGIYFIQVKVSQVGMEEKQMGQMKIISYLSPIMIGLFSYTAPAALPLYWAVGGVFVIFQTFVAKKLYMKNTSISQLENSHL